VPYKKTRIVIVDDEEDCRLTLRYHLQDHFDVVGEAKSGEEAIALCRDLHPDILLMDFNMPGIGGIKATTTITDLFPSITTIMQLREEDLLSAHKAMTAGARDYFKKPVQRNELLEVVKRTAKRHNERRTLLQDREDLPGSGIWSFTNGNGGIGQTSLIISIANELLYLKKNVLIVDMNMLFGDVITQLNITPYKANIANLLKHEEGYTFENIEENICTHSSGIKVLAPPQDILIATGIDLARLSNQILTLEYFYDYILLDMPTGINDNYVEILDNSRFIFVPACGSLCGIKNLKILLKIFQELNYPDNKVRSVLLQSEEECAPFKVLNSILTEVGSPFAHAFPYEPKISADAISAGEPISRFAPKCAYTHVVRNFLMPLLNLPPVEKTLGRTGTFFAKLFQ
jgi:pilus assembly protein CpaE